MLLDFSSSLLARDQVAETAYCVNSLFRPLQSRIGPILGTLLHEQMLPATITTSAMHESHSQKADTMSLVLSSDQNMRPR